jgi:hypothetical protein
METVHAVTYFAGESIASARAVGLRGFWMGYFGFRASPLGEASAEQVVDAFYNFAPSMVERAIPDAWQFATPATLVEARAVSAAAALRRLFEPVEQLASNVNDVLRRAARHESHSPASSLFGANRQIARRDPVEELWQLCTTIARVLSVNIRVAACQPAVSCDRRPGCQLRGVSRGAMGFDGKTVPLDAEAASTTQARQAAVHLMSRGRPQPGAQRRARDGMRDGCRRCATVTPRAIRTIS